MDNTVYQEALEYLSSIADFKVGYTTTEEQRQHIPPDCKAILNYKIETDTFTLITALEDLEENVITVAKELKVILKAKTTADIPDTCRLKPIKVEKENTYNEQKE